jgi:hypothetical protein
MKKKFTILVMIFTSHLALKAQFAYKTNLAQVVTTNTYTDLGTNGSTITTANNDDANSAATPIGFTFSYNGTAFTDFILNTNGFIKLGTTAPTSAAIYGGTQTSANSVLLTPASAGVGNQNCISIFNMDLLGNAGAEYRVFTSGTAPNRVCTIQYKDIAEKTATILPHYNVMNFQIKLFETTNVIEFVYGSFTAAATNANFRTAGVGLIGSDTSAANTIFVRKGSATLWTAATFVLRGVVVTATNQNLSYRNNAAGAMMPNSGLTYRFTPQPANDLTIDRVEGLGRAASPFTSPEVVKVKISNLGLNATAATTMSVSVSGANASSSTVNVPAIPSGASVTLPILTRSGLNLGNDTINCALGTDDNNSNNAAQLIQAVSNIIAGYTTINSPVSNSVGYNTGSGSIGCKYTISSPRYVKAVNVSIASAASTANNTVYAFVLDSGGAFLHRSPNYVIQAADLGQTVTFTLDTAALITTGKFYVFLAQTANATTGYFPVNTQAEATPARSQAYYIAGLTGGGIAEFTTLGRFMVDAVLDGADIKVDSVATNAICPTNNKTITTRIKNMDVLPLNLATDSVKLVATVSGPIPQTFTTILNSGVIAPGATQLVTITTSANFSTVGNYTIGVKSSTGKDVVSANDSTAITTTIANIIVNLGADISTCNSSTVLDAGNPGSTYLWSNSATTQTITATTNGSYNVTVTTPSGCVNSDTINVVLNSGVATATISPLTASICAGASTTLVGGPSGGTYSSNAPAGVFTSSVAGTYKVFYTVTTVCGTAIDSATITVNALPNVSGGSNVNICAGNVVTLSGSGASSYVWTGGISDGVAFVPASSGSYSVTGTDANGCSNSDTVNVTVNALPTVTGTASPSSVCAGSSVTLTGGGAISYVWTGGVTDGVPFVPTASGSYTVTGTDANNCFNTNTVSITVNANPVASIVPSGTTICAGGTTAITLAGSPAGGVFSVQAGAPSALTGNSFNPLATGNWVIVYTYTNASGCSDTAQIQFNVNCTVGLDRNSSIEHVSANIFPNPTKGKYQVRIGNASADKVTIKIMSYEGKLMSSSQSDIQQNSNIDFDMTNYAAGVYYVNIVIADYNKTIKLIKE